MSPKQPLWWFLGGAALTVVPTFVMRGLLLFGIGPWTTTVLLVFVALLAIPCMVVASVFSLIPSLRVSATLATMALLGLFLGAVFSEIVGGRVRILAMALAARRARPVVEAVEQHIQDQGAPPETISQLIPDYLARLPSRVPPLEVTSSRDTWRLRAGVSTGVANWDSLNYDPTFEGGSHWSIDDLGGGWYYFHE